MKNIYIAYEISKNHNIGSYSNLENCLSGAASLTKNADIDKCKCSAYGTGFDSHGVFSHSSGGTGRNVIIFRVDMNSSTKIDDTKKDILILGKGPTQRLKHTLQKKCIQLILLKMIKNYVWACIIMEKQLFIC